MIFFTAADGWLAEIGADIMRYFLDESPKEAVPVSTEVAFIENYMELERIRIRHGASINFEKAYNPVLRIPPMLGNSWHSRKAKGFRAIRSMTYKGNHRLSRLITAAG